jgi:selenocysteine lyase/cysteine desulfurase
MLASSAEPATFEDDAIVPFMDRWHGELNLRALDVWKRNPNMILLGADHPHRLPIFSFRVRNPRTGGYIHHQLFTRMLSDLFGIQARGGCACAGPYAHRLLEMDRATSDEVRKAVLSGSEIHKPGWIRLNLSCLMDDGKADQLICAVDELARNLNSVANLYWCD